MIQFVTFLSPIVGGRQQQPLSSGHFFTIPKRSPAELLGLGSITPIYIYICINSKFHQGQRVTARLKGLETTRNESNKSKMDIPFPPGTPRPTIYNWLFQLDDEPNLYIGNVFVSPNIHFKLIVWGSRLLFLLQELDSRTRKPPLFAPNVPWNWKTKKILSFLKWLLSRENVNFRGGGVYYLSFGSTPRAPGFQWQMKV